MAVKMRTGDLLVESGMITEQQLRSALEIQKQAGNKKLGDVLTDLGIISEEKLLGVLQKKLQVPFVSLSTLSVTDAVVSSFPESLAREKNVFPYRMTGNTLVIATADPLDYDSLNEIAVAIGKQVETVLATKKDIAETIHKYYSKQNIDSNAQNLSESTEVIARAGALDIEEIENRIGNAPVVKFINSLIVQAFSKRASDIHIEPYEEKLRIRYRIDGTLVDVVSLNISAHSSIVTRLKIMADMDIAEKRIPLDGRFNLEIEGSDISVRVSSMPTFYGEKMVLRIMADSKSGILPIHQLGMTPQNCALVDKAIHNPNGLILVTGPTGSGKSTTLYALLNELAADNTNVVTIEDPVEKIVPGCNQSQVNPKAGFTFANGLRAILRQDPDKIMVGEIRDTETADIAARSAITGHLVLASLHTNDAASTFMRLIDMGVEPYMVASSVIAVISQRLVKLICPYCKAIYIPGEEDLDYLRKIGVSAPKTMYYGKGCDKCDGTGSLGRTAIHEIVLTDSTIKQMIMQRAKSSDIAEYLVKNKSQRFMLDNAVDLIRAGNVYFKELLHIVQLLQ